jgi:DNA-binding CsgD family transcriptional regulator
VNGGLRSPLTPREIEVARLVARGLEAQRIGWMIGCSQRTIHQHVRNISAKLPGPVKPWLRVMLWALHHLPAEEE